MLYWSCIIRTPNGVYPTRRKEVTGRRGELSSSTMERRLTEWKLRAGFYSKEAKVFL